MPGLFNPLIIKEVELKNRIVVSPMCQYSSEDGFASDWHLVHLGSRAVGGAGLVIAEASAVSPEGRITPSDLGIWKDEHIDNLKRIVDFIHARGAAAGIQIAHAGRKASCEAPWDGGHQLSKEDGGWQTVAPSAVPFRENDSLPHELSPDEIKKVTAYFRAAAQRAAKAGFKVLEIHAAHGYLINEFLSPLTNLRTDEYGGSFDKRIRLLLEIINEVQSAWPEKYPLCVRISAVDWAEGGWDLDDSVRLAEVLKNNGADLMDCSSGGVVMNAKIEAKPGYQVPFAEAIKKQTGMLTGAVGLITEARQAENIIANDQADLIILAREHLRDPYFALHAAKELGANTQWPVQYERAKR